MRRRDFITLAGGSAAAWPLAARAQQPERMRRVGVLMGFAENDPEGKLWFFSFAQAFQELGWIDGRNVRIDVRWDVSNSDPNQKLAKELVSLKSRRDPRAWDATDCFASARNTHDPDRIWGCFRPGRRRLRGKPFPPGQEYYRIRFHRR